MASALFELVFAPPAGEEDVGGRGSAHRPSRVLREAQDDEAEILARLAQDDVAALDQLVVAYDRPLRQFARRMVHDRDVADDVVQDVFVWLWEHRAALRVTGTLRSYLYGAVRNGALGVLRRARTEEACAVRIDPQFGIPGMGIPVPGTAAAAERAELAAALTAALDALPARTRQAALLRWRDRLGRAEIAAIMGVAVPTVNNQLTQAARVVRDLLAPHVPTDP